MNAQSCHLGRYRTGMAVIAVKVKAKDSDKTVITYAFLDNGSNSSFCTVSDETTWSERSKDKDISVYTGAEELYDR